MLFSSEQSDYETSCKGYGVIIEPINPGHHLLPSGLVNDTRFEASRYGCPQPDSD
jgi:hypothetical protein